MKDAMLLRHTWRDVVIGAPRRLHAIFAAITRRHTTPNN